MACHCLMEAEDMRILDQRWWTLVPIAQEATLWSGCLCQFPLPPSHPGTRPVCTDKRAVGYTLVKESWIYGTQIFYNGKQACRGRHYCYLPSLINKPAFFSGRDMISAFYVYFLYKHPWKDNLEQVVVMASFPKQAEMQKTSEERCPILSFHDCTESRNLLGRKEPQILSTTV